MTPVAIEAPEFDLRLTLESGQVFHWEPAGRGWNGLIDRYPVQVEQVGERLLVPAGTEILVSRYFSLDHPMRKILRTFPRDRFTSEAVKACRGIRIIRQPKWECLATFLTSAMKQVSHIRAMSRALRNRFGDAVEGSSIRAYPSPEAIATASEAELRACGLGFRAPNLQATARWIAEGRLDLDAIDAMDSSEALEELCRLPGVGRKIANCVLLFAYERLDAVPVDVWIGRVLRAMQAEGASADLEAFSRARFGPYAGYVQQYLFHHARVSKTLPTS
jgi:3-methyladenine DNA glycosylase/8-oxoguanine DNA glycosylase